MSKEELQSMHIKVPEDYYERLKKESSDTGKPMKKIIMDALDLSWELEQTSISLKDAIEFEMGHQIFGQKINVIALKFVSEDLLEKAKEIISQAENANLIDGFQWNSPEGGSDDIYDMILNGERIWIDELIKMRRDGSLEREVKKIENKAEIEKAKEKLLPRLKEQKILSEKQIINEINRINELEKNIEEFNYDDYVAKLKEKYPDLENKIRKVNIEISIENVKETFKEIYPEKTEEEINEIILSKLS